MDKYYYLVSQLPTLFFDRENYMTIDLFFNEAEKWLSKKDFDALLLVDINDISLNERFPHILCKYKEFETQLRNEIAQWRKAQKLGQEHKIRMFPVSVVKEGNPLEVEKKLLEHRWKFTEEMELGHYFDLNFLILYILKLQMLRRLSTFNKEEGFKKFQKICGLNYE